MAICRNCLKHSVVFPGHFLKQLASHVSADTLRLIPGYKIFSHPSRNSPLDSVAFELC